MEEQQNPKVETVENAEQVQDENENQAQTQNNDEQSEEDIEKRKKYENEQIARINLIFGKPTDFQKLYEEYAKEFQVIAQKRAEVENLKSESNTENDNDKQENNDNDNETQESELKTAEKKLKDAEKEFAGRWGLNPEELSDKIEVLQVGCVATVVPQHLTFKEKEERNNVLKKAMEINLYKKLPEFAKFLQVRGINAKLEQFGDDMAKFDPGCDAEAVSYFLDEFCELEKQKEEIKAQKEKEEREKKEKESIKDKAKDAKKEADEKSENSEPESEQPESEQPESEQPESEYNNADSNVPDLS